MESVDPKYRYPTNDSNRAHNQAYFLRRNGEKVRVCKKFFMATLDIGDTMIRTTIAKRNSNLIVEMDHRGRHRKQKVLDPALKDAVRSHINSIPRVESHYLRNQTSRDYFEGSLNISTLYRLYKEKCLENNSPYVKKSMYEHIFNTEFNIGFHKPKKDQCSTCECYRNSSEEDRRQLQEMYEKHLRDKDLSREENAKDVEDAKTKENKIVAVYDLQAVLPSPSGDVSSFYYKSRLATYNFTMYDIVRKQGYCYVWSEHRAKLGANEIGTCFLNFLRMNADGKSIVFFSDNCAGQNKNKFIAAMYLFAVSNLNIPSITHKFLVTGHTQNEGDSMHSCIEREKKRVLKSGPIYVPSQWIPVIRLAKKKGNPYIIQEMDTSDIYNLKKLSEDMGKNFNESNQHEKVLWSNIKILNFRKDEPYFIYYKYNYDDAEYKFIDIRGRKSTRSLITNTFSLKPAYECSPKISKDKKDGLLFLCKTKAIKQQYHSFYKNLPSNQ
ncbi:unnamed protein product [Callosobruchus maculatus]|uniref:DUF7869 domain-containing protein n=1 Tax=Callosobruchus maculatus TaxID=64391 RepID=A0A653BIL8_CALMS|nr:unnamed protein product [Callosobruchus maculatus]